MNKDKKEKRGMSYGLWTGSDKKTMEKLSTTYRKPDNEEKRKNDQTKRQERPTENVKIVRMTCRANMGGWVLRGRLLIRAALHHPRSEEDHQSTVIVIVIKYVANKSCPKN